MSWGLRRFCIEHFSCNLHVGTLIEKIFSSFFCSELRLAGINRDFFKCFGILSLLLHLLSFLVDVLSSLQSCHWSLFLTFGVLSFFLLVVVFHCFLPMSLLLSLYFHTVACLPWIHSLFDQKQIKSQRTPIFKMLFLMFCFCLWISLLIPHDNLALSNCKQGKKRNENLRGPATILSYRAILVAIVSQNSFVLVFGGYRTIITRYVAKWGIAQMCLCETKCSGGVSHHFGELLTSLKKHRAIWGIAAMLSQYRAIWGH